MAYYELLSLPQKWLDDVQYQKKTIQGVFPGGLAYISVPLVVYNGTVYYAAVSAPKIGENPSSSSEWLSFVGSNIEEEKEGEKIINE